MRVKLTRANVEAVAPPATGVLFVRDTEVPGFGVRITATGSKSWIVERKVERKTVRQTIGRVGVMPLPDARAAAMAVLARLAAGEIPVREEPAKSESLKDVFDAYIKERTSRTPGLKERTARDYRILFERLADWHDMPVEAITRQMVADRHGEISEKAPPTANRVMRVLSAITNHAADRGLIAGSPVTVLRQRRLWNREKRRTRHLDAHSLPDWWKLTDDISERWADRADVLRDYWRFLLLTGMRSDEAARLRVELVDLKRKCFTVGDMKNRDDHAMPVGPYLFAILQRRVAHAKATKSEWVFPAPKREHTSAGHDVRYLLNAKHGLEWSPHDLRRTFATVLDSLDVSQYVVKRLLGHRSGGDVTGGYIITDLDRLRPVMERAEAKILAMCGAG